MSKARVLLHWLNDKAGKRFEECSTNLKLIGARLGECGEDTDGCKRMIDRQCQKWKGDPKMDDFLRPMTLFGKEKFRNYYDCRDNPVLREGFEAKPHPPQPKKSGW